MIDLGRIIDNRRENDRIDVEDGEDYKQNDQNEENLKKNELKKTRKTRMGDDLSDDDDDDDNQHQASLQLSLPPQSSSDKFYQHPPPPPKLYQHPPPPQQLPYNYLTALEYFTNDFITEYCNSRHGKQNLLFLQGLTGLNFYFCIQLLFSSNHSIGQVLKNIKHVQLYWNNISGIIGSNNSDPMITLDQIPSFSCVSGSISPSISPSGSIIPSIVPNITSSLDTTTITMIATLDLPHPIFRLTCRQANSILRLLEQPLPATIPGLESFLGLNHLDDDNNNDNEEKEEKFGSFKNSSKKIKKTSSTTTTMTPLSRQKYLKTTTTTHYGNWITHYLSRHVQQHHLLSLAGVSLSSAASELLKGTLTGKISKKKLIKNKKINQKSILSGISPPTSMNIISNNNGYGDLMDILTTRDILEIRKAGGVKKLKAMLSLSLLADQSTDKSSVSIDSINGDDEDGDGDDDDADNGMKKKKRGGKKGQTKKTTKGRAKTTSTAKKATKVGAAAKKQKTSTRGDVTTTTVMPSGAIMTITRYGDDKKTKTRGGKVLYKSQNDNNDGQNDDDNNDDQDGEKNIKKNNKNIKNPSSKDKDKPLTKKQLAEKQKEERQRLERQDTMWDNLADGFDNLTKF